VKFKVLPVLVLYSFTQKGNRTSETPCFFNEPCIKKCGETLMWMPERKGRQIQSKISLNQMLWIPFIFNKESVQSSTRDCRYC